MTRRGTSDSRLPLLPYIALIILHFFLNHPLKAQERSFAAVRTHGIIIIDGKLDEPEWQREGVRGMVQREPQDGAPESESTEAWFAFDDDALYVAVRMYDSAPDSILGRLVRRDEDFRSDFIYVGIDPKLDRNTGYYFGTNPSGSINDGTMFDDNKTDDSFDLVWDVAVTTDGLGWTAEYRIPFSQLRFTESDEYVWGVDLYRRIHRKSEESLFAHHPRNDDIRVSRFPILTGLKGFSPPPRVEILPYFTATGKFLPSPPVAFFNLGRRDPFVLGRDYSGSIGADAKIGLSGDFTLDVSVNPDFAQAEVDPAVVNLTAFETYFEEKRPFFIEGSAILSFGRGGAGSFFDFNWSDPAFFYSRRIGRVPQSGVTHDGYRDIPDRTTILGAAKVSGKTADGWSLAALTALTQREYGEVDSAGARFVEEIEPMTLYGVIRTQKQFDESRQSLGLIGTVVARDLAEPSLQGTLGSRAMSLALDGWTFLDAAKTWILTGWTGISHVGGSSEFLLNLQRSPTHWFQKPDASHVSIDSTATSMGGWAGRVWIAKDKGNWRVSGAVGFIDPGFESNDMGFHTYTDVINLNLFTGYSWYDPDPVFRTKSVSFSALREFNFGGQKTGETYVVSADGELLSFWGGSAALGYNPEVYDDKRTRGGPLMKSPSSYYTTLYLYSDTRQDLHGSLFLSADRGTSGGWDYGISGSLDWKITTALNLEIGPSYSRNHLVAQYVDAIDDPSAAATYGKRYVFGVLDRKTLSANLRLNWTFAPRMSFQLYVQPYFSAGQYSSFRSLARPSAFTFDSYPYSGNPDFNFKSIRANAVFRWEYVRGSTFYLVWTNEKTDFEEQHGVFSVSRDFSQVLRTRPANVLSVKMTYWLTP